MSEDANMEQATLYEAAAEAAAPAAGQGPTVSRDKADIILERCSQYGILPGTQYPTVYDALIGMLDAVDQRIAELRADAERWKEYAQHQEWCQGCSDSVHDCETGTQLRDAALCQRAEQRGSEINGQKNS